MLIGTFRDIYHDFYQPGIILQTKDAKPSMFEQFDIVLQPLPPLDYVPIPSQYHIGRHHIHNFRLEGEMGNE